MKSFVNAILILLGAGACLGIGLGVRNFALELSKETGSAPKADPLAVEVTRIQSRPLEDRIELVGSLTAASEVTIRARTAGYITKLPFELGQLVPAGELVVELDPLRAREELSRARSALKVTAAQLTASRSRAVEADTRLARMEKLYQSKAVTAQQVEEARSLAAVAAAEVELNVASVEQAESAVSTAELNLKECEIKTPFAGYVAERFVEVGDLADPATPLLRIVALDTIHTVVNVVEKDYGKLKPSQTATIAVDAYPGLRFQGVVKRVSPVIDELTRTAAVEIEIDNRDGYLKPGMFARVSLTFEEKPQAVTVPLAAVVESDDLAFVFVVEPKGDRAQRRAVTTGIQDGTFVEILAGLQGHETIVALGSRLLNDGDLVKIVTGETTAETSEAPQALAKDGPDDSPPQGE